jgi:fumarate hydratase subunit alpha
MNYKKIITQVEELTAQAAFVLPSDVKAAIKAAIATEKNHKIKTALALILQNADIAAQEQLAICQDTGLPVVFITVGKNVKFDCDILEAIRVGVAQGYEKNYLRPSCVPALKRGRSSYDVTEMHVDFDIRAKGLQVTILPKGFGSENKSRLKMFNPTSDVGDIKDFVVESIRLAGPDSCPPFFVGVGIGSTSDGSLLLAKKALLEPVNRMTIVEKDLLNDINKINTGVMGLGGVTALSVKIKETPTHIAGLPVAVNISCHALRRASGEIKL